MDLVRIATEGGRKDAQMAQALEEQLRAAPDNQEARAGLLGYYFLRAPPGGAERPRYLQQVLWFIRNAPKSDLAGSGYSHFHPETDRKAFNSARSMWLKHLKKSPDNLPLMGNAAEFLLGGDRRAAEQLYRRAVRLEPREPRWRQRLGNLHRLESRTGHASGRRRAARKALAFYEAARRLTRRPELRFYQLDGLAEVAFDAGYGPKAARYARELLRLAGDFPTDWNYGNALHRGHAVLGRLAFRSRRIPTARLELLKSGQTPGSPQLNSFGPSFELARELLERGEWEVVGEYLRAVGAFWKMGEGQLRKWSEDVAAHRMPDFDQGFLYRSFPGKPTGA